MSGKKKKRLSEEELDMVDDTEEIEEIDEEEERAKSARRKTRRDARKAAVRAAAEAELEDSDDEEEELKPKVRRVAPGKDDFDFKISHTHDAAMAKLLRSRGVSPIDIMHGTKNFSLEDVVQPIEALTFGKLKKINKNKQLNWYESSYKRVLSQSWLSAGIGGFPSDARAKQVALHLFIRAIEEYQSRDPRKNQNRSLPLWHHVYGGFGDKLRDMSSDFPSFIVISNITPECTGLKMEKVRDCLTKFNNLNIPVVVVCAGQDPYTLFTNRLYYPMRWGLHIGHATTQL
jgi:hypothetical protein